MARVRQMVDPAPTTETIISAPAGGDWPFKAETESAVVPPPPPPAPVAAAPAPAVPTAEPVRQRAPRSDAGQPRAKPAAAPAAPKELSGVLGLVTNDMLLAAELVVQADKRHIPSALDELEMRIKVVRAVLGS